MHVLRAYEELATFKAQYEGNDLDIAHYREKLKEGMTPDEEYIKCLRAQPLRRIVAVRHFCVPALGYMLLGFVTRTCTNFGRAKSPQRLVLIESTLRPFVSK